MKKIFYLILLILFSVNGYSQKNNQNEDKISNFFQVKAKPVDQDIEDWKRSIMKDMKAKWNLSFSEVVLRFVVEKDGTVSNLAIFSEEWKPSEQQLYELLSMINSKSKWVPGSTNNKSLRTGYSIKLFFQT